MRELKPGDRQGVGRYTFTHVLGKGGMGVVYLARRGKHQAAVKFIHDSDSQDEHYRERFKREIMAVQQVNSHLVASVIESGTSKGELWYASEYIPGPTLEQDVKNRPYNESDLRKLAKSLHAALAAIHKARVVHRDLKPMNIIISKDGPRVVDFGIAFIADQPTLTATGRPIGTFGYMAPEQMEGLKNPAPASDIFAYGCVLAYAAMRRHLFDGDSSQARMHAVMWLEPDLSGIPRSVRHIIARCIHKDPRKRATLDEIAGMLGLGASGPMAGAPVGPRSSPPGSGRIYGVPLPDLGPPKTKVETAPGSKAEELPKEHPPLFGAAPRSPYPRDVKPAERPRAASNRKGPTPTAVAPPKRKKRRMRISPAVQAVMAVVALLAVVAGWSAVANHTWPYSPSMSALQAAGILPPSEITIPEASFEPDSLTISETSKITGLKFFGASRSLEVTVNPDSIGRSWKELLDDSCLTFSKKIFGEAPGDIFANRRSSSSKSRTLVFTGALDVPGDVKFVPYCKSAKDLSGSIALGAVDVDTKDPVDGTRVVIATALKDGVLSVVFRDYAESTDMFGRMCLQTGPKTLHPSSVAKVKFDSGNYVRLAFDAKEGVLYKSCSPTGSEGSEQYSYDGSGAEVPGYFLR